MNKLITPKKTDSHFVIARKTSVSDKPTKDKVIARKTLVSDEAIPALLSLRGGVANEAISAFSSSLTVKKKLNGFFTFFLVTAISLTPLPSFAQIPVCEMTPTCASLGYDKSVADCAGYRMLRCPLDSSAVYCLTRPLTAGDFLFGDGSTGSKLISGKTPIGIVFDTENKLAVALTDIDSSGAAGSTAAWSSNTCDTPNLDNCGILAVKSCSVDGRANTTAILASTCNGTTYAANGANNYEPSVCTKDFCKKTMWFLPSARDLQNLYNVKSYVNASLSLTASNGSKTLTESDYYWSSAESSSHYAWGLRMSDGASNGVSKTYKNLYVRPVIDFSNPDYVAPSCSADFILSSCDTSIGTCDECGGKYKYTKCNNGWTLSGGNCKVVDCRYYFDCSGHTMIRTSGVYTDEECKTLGSGYKTTTLRCQSGNTLYYGCECPYCVCE